MGVYWERKETVLDDIKVWLVNDASSVTALEASASMASEFLLEEVLVKNPDLLVPGLTLVGRQTPTEGGPLDLLGVDSDGRLVVFELKRGILSRDAVAQIIDYASDLDSKSDIALAEHITVNSGVGGIRKIDDFEEWYSDNRDVDSLGALRPLRLFLIGLGADDRTERMVRFLARNSGMGISLLTFHGFTHDGKTLLARQVEVEGATEPGGPSGRRYLSVAEKRERLEKRTEEYGVTELLTAARDMFHEKWPSCRENIGPTAISFLLSERTESGRRALSYARIDVDQGRIRAVFYGRAINLCPDEFDQAKQAIPFETYRGPSDTEGTYAEVKFSLDATGWGTHKERLAALMQAVYQAWEQQG